MKKVIVIGCPGAGKSKFSGALSELTALPLYHLDMLYWNSDKTTVSKELFRARLKNIIAFDKWIIDGNYGSTIEMRLKECDTVFLLDYPVEICLEGVRERMCKPRADMPWIETEPDVEFMQFIEDFSKNSLPAIYELIEKYGAEKQIIIFKSRAESDEYIKMLKGIK